MSDPQATANGAPMPAPPPAKPADVIDALLTPEEQRTLKLIQTIEGLSRTVTTKINSPLFLDAVANRILRSDFLRESVDQMVQAAVQRALKPTSNAKVFTGTIDAAFVETPPPGSVPRGLRVFLHEDSQGPGQALKVSPTGPNHPLYPNSFDVYVELTDNEGGSQWVEGRAQLIPEAVEAITAALLEAAVPAGDYRFAVIAAMHEIPEAPAEADTAP